MDARLKKQVRGLKKGFQAGPGLKKEVLGVAGVKEGGCGG